MADLRKVADLWPHDLENVLSSSPDRYLSLR